MSDTPESANVVGTAVVSVEMVTDGECIRNTIQDLEDGVGSGKPMPRAALEKARVQAIGLLERVLTSYATEVAEGEVGARGSGRASDAEPKSEKCPTGLLYGRIQSGKTLGMITFAALAIDNGFRVIVVLTSDNVKLVEQTADRFKALDAIHMNSGLAAGWKDENEHVRQNLAHKALVIICQKNQKHLETLVEFLDEIGAAKYPALIMDDEADQATLDTTTNSRAAGRPNAPKEGSAIHRKTVKNDRKDQLGESVAETLKHHLFLQVTATPYALLLQNADSALRPSFTVLLEPGDGYTGGESFFSSSHIVDQQPPLIFVDEQESTDLEHGLESAPPGLVAALSFFLVASVAQNLLDRTSRAKPQNFLCHTSQKQMEHEKVSKLIRKFLSDVGTAILSPTVDGLVGIELAKALEELKRTVPDAPSLDVIVAELKKRLPRRNVIVVNSSGANAEFKSGTNFIVGGNILGRGLTIENLLVSYYLRHAKVSQMDTMLQHARMFGYREPLMPYTRVFLPSRLAVRFFRIHTAEQHLRELLADPKNAPRVHIEVSSADGLRATRNAVLDMESVVAYTAGQQIYPAGPLLTGKDVDKKHDWVREQVSKLGGSLADMEGHQTPITLDQLIDLVGELPYDKVDEDSWEPRALQQLLRANADRFKHKGLLYTRKFRRKKEMLTGALSGDILKELRAKQVPVVCVFLDDTGKYMNCDRTFTYPTLVLPKDSDMPAHVFNAGDK